MRNEQDAVEYSEAAPVRRCGHCGEPLLAQRTGAKYCGRRCKELAREARKRRSERLARLRENHPYADAALTETDPGDDLREFSDYDDMIGPDDEPGIHAGNYAEPDQWQTSNEAFNSQMNLLAAIDRIYERYEQQLKPYRDQMKRNVGVKPAAMARLELARDGEIRELVRKHEHAAALDRAARSAPQRAVRAQERQDGIKAMQDFSRDLGRGGRYKAGPAFHGRQTAEVFNYPE